MKLSRKQYEAAYQIGLEFYEQQGKLGIAEAKRRLIPTGLNSNTAADLIYNVGHLLRGECYKRGLSVSATDDYLTWIRRDHRDTALTKALHALEQHIAYRQKKKSADTSQGLRLVLKKHRALMNGLKESALILEWKDAESDGVMDWLPLSWFAEEGIEKNRCHPVGERGKRQGDAFCDVRVTGRIAELDYRPYQKLNDANDVLLGVVRLQFSDEDRTSIAGVEWKNLGDAEFAPAEFNLPTPFVPSPKAAYRPPTKAASKVERLIRERPGQVKFRRELTLAYDRRCCISRCSVPAVLEGAHIDGYRGPGSNHIQNGLLLRSDLHALFDRHLIAIDPETMHVHVAKSARGAAGYQQFHGVKVNEPERQDLRPDRTVLRLHWQKWNKG